MLYVLVKRFPMSRNESWRTGEKRWGLRAKLFSHTMSGGMFLVPPFAEEEWVKFFFPPQRLVEFIGAVKNCSEVACGWWSESANWLRPALALFCCRALWESVSLLRRLWGLVGWGLFWFVASLHNSWQPLSIAATNNFQLPGNYTERKQMFYLIFAHF